MINAEKVLYCFLVLVGLAVCLCFNLLGTVLGSLAVIVIVRILQISLCEQLHICQCVSWSRHRLMGLSACLRISVHLWTWMWIAGVISCALSDCKLVESFVFL